MNRLDRIEALLNAHCNAGIDETFHVAQVDDLRLLIDVARAAHEFLDLNAGYDPFGTQELLNALAPLLAEEPS
jgi:hypothetical protein